MAPEATVLDDIIAGVREDLASRQAVVSRADLARLIADLPPALDPLPDFAAPGISVIAEVKRSSPSKGHLAEIADPAELAAAYQSGGAHAISVLTEQRRFHGSLADLDAVRARVQIPVLRKDFVVTDYQLFEARAHGADLALLIVAALSQAQLLDLIEVCTGLGLTPLVEVHTPEETERAVATGARLIGVNNRNLKTLAVDNATFARLAELIPADRIKVAESGVRDTADVAAFAAAGADVVLVGEALVTGGTPAETVAAFRAAGR
ncbi:indole-3-glycerol phosphate synthase TrpC [Granulicoccus phenolivorans]|uniref:indole-3-glycerol phosphate synthase TrpC n=1 Tax=Granulicoccus phenolivorans TaxID=266854 RepID=UPI00040D2C69|nr:indole-3-glycerol phosphate synthase TrpC [Granulicoccus phenolivorans]